MSAFGRRSRREAKEGAKNIFTIDSRSALEEYVKAKPEQILSIQVRPENADAWVKLSEKNGLGAGIVKVNNHLESPVLGTVKLNGVGWNAFVEQSFADNEVILVLDHLTDPRNLGAIARTAAFFGVRWILAPQYRQVLYTQASVATSMGGFALVDLVLINNLSVTLGDLKSLGFEVWGAHMSGTSLDELNVSGKSAIVLGAEDKGLSPKVRDHCDKLVTISRHPHGLESLNVSVAAGIIINRFLS